MKKAILLLFCTVVFLASFFCTGTNQSKEQKVKRLYTQQLDSFSTAAFAFKKSVEKGIQDSIVIIKQFHQLRHAYKRIELFVDYYNPSTAKAINGPALFEVEAENPAKPNPPSGFQVIEEVLFPTIDTASFTVVMEQAEAMQSFATRLSAVNTTTAFTEMHLWDIFKISIIRLQTLGLSGYDSPIAQQSVSEAATTLAALQLYLSVYVDNNKEDSVSKLITVAREHLLANQDFNLFGRAYFFTQYLTPLLKRMALLQKKFGIPYFNESRPLRAEAVSLFEKGAWNPWFYSATQKDISNNSMIALGEKLFYDNKLSLNNTRNCGSCHQANKAFTDGLVKSGSFDGRKLILRNTPTLLYAALQPVQFADSRLVYLEDQAKQVIENPNELHGNLELASRNLRKDASYQLAFTQAFGSDTISPLSIQQAIAAYIRTKASFHSAFDEYMQGNLKAMSTEAVKGFNLFMGKAKCGTCHFMPLFNGVVPPHFMVMESEVLGTPAQNKPPYTLDTDSGKYTLYRSPLHLHAFKTPTVRNAAVTAPYMHNGVFTSLEQLLDFYNKGGGVGIGLSVPNQTLPADPLGLTDAETKSIIAFIQALTDK